MIQTNKTNNPDLWIKPVADKADLSVFLGLPYDIYRGEPQWRAPLRFERAEQINPVKNPALDGLELQHFIAYLGPKGDSKQSRAVGRISAIVNSHYLERYQNETGHFGFFDTYADGPDVSALEIAQALFGACEAWLKARGLKHVLGPFNLTVNEEVGILIDGYDTPPMMLMSYGRPDYPQTLEALGLSKAQDMYAFWTDMHAGYPRGKAVDMCLRLVAKDKKITLRKARRGKILEDVGVAMDIFNDAWSENWGFVHFSKAQAKHMAQEIMPLMIRDLFWFIEYEGEPVAFVLMLPNLNEAIAGLDGKLLPFGWAKLIYRLKIKGLKTARIPLMGVSSRFRKTRKGTAMAAALSEKVFEMGRARGFTHVEMGWILDDNQSMISIIKEAEGKAYKTYRMYQKEIH